MPFSWRVVSPVPVMSAPPFLMLMFVQPLFAPPAVNDDVPFSVNVEFAPSMLMVELSPLKMGL